MELFSEVYGCYYTVVAKILALAQNGATRLQMEELVQSSAFYDSTFHLLPKLFSREWQLLREHGGKYYSMLENAPIDRPMTRLEISWLKALMLDKRMALFMDENAVEALDEAVGAGAPLFLPGDFHIYDQAMDGDPYGDSLYRQNFRAVLNACKLSSPLAIAYESGKGNRVHMHLLPVKINYSQRDDKMRVLGYQLKSSGRYERVILNIARIVAVEASERPLPQSLPGDKPWFVPTANEPISLRVSLERNALERCMLQFASWEKRTEYLAEQECYLCQIYYDKQDESELLIRILSFGPAIQVIGPPAFLAQVKYRINKQRDFNLTVRDGV